MWFGDLSKRIREAKRGGKMSEEKVKYWNDRIYDAHCYKKDTACEFLTNIFAEIQRDTELTETERKKVLKFCNEIIRYVQDRPEEYD